MPITLRSSNSMHGLALSMAISAPPSIQSDVALQLHLDSTSHADDSKTLSPPTPLVPPVRAEALPPRPPDPLRHRVRRVLSVGPLLRPGLPWVHRTEPRRTRYVSEARRSMAEKKKETEAKERSKGLGRTWRTHESFRREKKSVDGDAGVAKEGTVRTTLAMRDVDTCSTETLAREGRRKGSKREIAASVGTQEKERNGSCRWRRDAKTNAPREGRKRTWEGWVEDAVRLAEVALPTQSRLGDERN